jgi:hypothetical protein
MTTTKSGSGLFLLLALAALLVGALLLARAPAVALPTLPHAAAPAAAGRYLIRSNWGEIEVTVDGATLEHAIAGHGSMAQEALDMARRGYCQPYLPCGSNMQTLAEGLKGYFLCPLSNGQLWLIPFRADALLLRLVAFTAYPVRAGYEPRVRVRGDCVPVELLPALLYEGGDYDGDSDQ